MYSKESDEFLIKEFRSGNNKAFGALLNKYKHRVLCYILQMVKWRIGQSILENEIF